MPRSSIKIRYPQGVSTNKPGKVAPDHGQIRSLDDAGDDQARPFGANGGVFGVESRIFMINPSDWEMSLPVLIGDTPMMWVINPACNLP